MKNVIITLCLCLLFSVAEAVPSPGPAVSLENFKLLGDLAEGQAHFTLTANARVLDRKGGSLELLSGAIALTEVGSHPKWRLRADENRFILTFDRAGTYPVEIKFTA